MKVCWLLFFMIFGFVQTQAQCGETVDEKKMTKKEVQFKELPDDAKLDDEVRVDEFDDKGVFIGFHTITVEQKLREIGAKYVESKLVDKNGREIRFFKRQIRGASEGFEKDEEFRKSEEKRLADLKKDFMVIEIFVNPLKVS